MKSFEEMYDFAEKKKGGKERLEDLLPSPESPDSLKQFGDDRYLSGMSKAIFQAGFVWRVVENKWADFEEAFFEFDIEKNAKLSYMQLDKYLHDKRIVRNMQKIKTVRENAGMILKIQKKSGSFAKFIAEWPSSDYYNLLIYLKQNGSRLGGNSCQYFLRAMGKESFVLSTDVVKELENQKVIDGSPLSKTSLKKAQSAFNIWKEESGRSLSEISRILAFQIGA